MKSYQGFLYHFQWHLFSIVCAVSCIALFAYILPVRRLYIQPEIRTQARVFIEQSANRYGLPKSDFFFTYIGKHDSRLCRRVYQRGHDPVFCDWISSAQLPQ